MTQLQIKKAACDAAFATAAQNAAAADVSVATKATELQLTDPQYQQFRSAFGIFRQQFSAAAAADATAAKNAADKAAAAAKSSPAAQE
jgi:hypothetical protein